MNFDVAKTSRKFANCMKHGVLKLFFSVWMWFEDEDGWRRGR